MKKKLRQTKEVLDFIIRDWRDSIVRETNITMEFIDPHERVSELTLSVYTPTPRESPFSS